MNIEKPTSYIAVEGNIASGKSTLVTEWKKGLKEISVNFEPVEQWRKFPFGVDLIEKFGKGERGAAMGLQVAALSCFEELLKGLEGEEFVLTERSVLSSYNVFGRVNQREGNLSIVEWSVLTHLYNRLPEWMRYPQLIIYVMTPADMCKDRISGRGRPGENELTLDYLQKLEEEHDTMLSETKSCVIKIDGRWRRKYVYELATVAIKGFMKGENGQVLSRSPPHHPITTFEILRSDK